MSSKTIKEEVVETPPIQEKREEEAEEEEVDTPIKEEETNNNPKTTTPAKKAKKKDDDCYCSLCWGEDSEDKRLAKCKDCGVLYHHECYRGVILDDDEDDEDDDSASSGAKDKKKDPLEDTCLACASVGQIVKGRTQAGETDQIKVESRPYECCFCSVDNPNLPLAMHPVYDRNNGRQLIVEDKINKAVEKRRLAWCHTLCGDVIGLNEHTGGCVYGCNSRGYYGGFDGDGDDRSIGSDIQQERDKEEADPDNDDPQLDAVTHFVIVLDELKTVWPKFVNAIKHAKAFKCSVCLKVDNKDPSIHRMCVSVSKIKKKAFACCFGCLACWLCCRLLCHCQSLLFRFLILLLLSLFFVQCMCKETQEPNVISKCHSDDECLTAFHVGCAMWGDMINGRQRFPMIRRVYYSYEYDKKKAACNLLYCNKHAKELKTKAKKLKLEGTDYRRYPGQKDDDKENENLVIPEDVQCFPIVNAGTVVESDFEDEVDDYDDDEIDDDSSLEGDESSEESLVGDENEPSNAARNAAREKKRQKNKKRRERKKQQQKDGSNAKRAKSKDGTKRRKRGKVEDSVHDRLNQKMSKKHKGASSTAGPLPAGPFIGRAAGSQQQPRKNATKSLAQSAAAAPEKVVEETREEEKKQPLMKKKKKTVLKVGALVRGKGYSAATEEIADHSATAKKTSNDKIRENKPDEGGRDHRRKSLVAHMVKEVALKREYRRLDNNLEAVLKDVESHWKHELPRCGFHDVDSLFQSVRQEVKKSAGRSTGVTESARQEAQQPAVRSTSSIIEAARQLAARQEVQISAARSPSSIIEAARESARQEAQKSAGRSTGVTESIRQEAQTSAIVSTIASAPLRQEAHQSAVSITSVSQQDKSSAVKSTNQSDNLPSLPPQAVVENHKHEPEKQEEDDDEDLFYPPAVAENHKQELEKHEDDVEEIWGPPAVAENLEKHEEDDDDLWN